MNNKDIFFTPKIISDYFIELTQKAHPSGGEDPLRQWVIKKVSAIQNKYTDNRGKVQVKFYHPEAKEPDERIIFLQRKGANLYADKLPVILQAHLDMVAVPGEKIFPLKLDKYTENNITWLRALKDLAHPEKGGTTLGADDGIGVATILSVLEEETLQDMPLECLFTVQEETDMASARNFDVNLLTGSKFINLDAADLKVIIYGSAGGCASVYKRKVACRESMESSQIFRISVSGLKSGHSGADINKGRQNAIKIITDILVRLNGRINRIDAAGRINSYDLLLHTINRTDRVVQNSIPAEAQAVVSVPVAQADNFVEDINKLLDLTRAANMPVEDQFSASVRVADSKELPMTAACTDSVLLLLKQLPHGVISMIPARPGLVETSTNLFDVVICDGELQIRSFNRSSNIEALSCLNNIQMNMARCFGFEPTINIDHFPLWQPDDSSELLKIAKSVYQKIYGPEAEATVIHAGLECGWIIERCGTKVECISIGPTIQDLHSENERLQLEDNGINTIESYYHAVLKIILNSFTGAR
ncbi:MAG: M20/M25/M40 family metallo-hydrolase [Desulfotomaculaceae bacterium]|nr:M20/M25/M40 family metallo-hydrolase [Desulfotomaculaceae bacterium]